MILQTLAVTLILLSYLSGMFYVSHESLLGRWKRKDTGYIYEFIGGHSLIVNETLLSYSLEQRGRDDTRLVIDGKKFEFVVLHPKKMFAVWANKNIVEFWYI